MTANSRQSGLPGIRFSTLMRDAMRGDRLSPGSRLRIVRPLDAESLTGRHDGRARKTPGGGARDDMSSALQRRLGALRSDAGKDRARKSFQIDPRQRAVVKVHYFSHGGGGAGALKAHVRYVAREAATPSPDFDPEKARSERAQAVGQTQAVQRTPFYDALGDGVDGAARAARWAKEDRRHFRVILSAENATQLRDLKSFTREVMERAEAALGTRLDWVAVNHWDTDNPHTHIIIRGRDGAGRDLVIPRAFVSHGFRNAARDVATERLGRRSRNDGRLALQREARAHRPTRLDPLIEAHIARDGRLRIAALRAPDGGADMTDALKARARELERLGFAKEVGAKVLLFEPGWRDGLKAIELHLDVRKALMQSRAQSRSSSPPSPVRTFSRDLRRQSPDR